MLSYITIKQLREIRGYSQEYMASLLNITQPAYSKIENSRTITDDSKLQIIAKTLQANIKYIKSNRIPIIFYIDDVEELNYSLGRKLSEVETMLLKNITDQREMLYKLINNGK